MTLIADLPVSLVAVLWLCSACLCTADVLAAVNFTEAPTIEIPASVREAFRFPTNNPTLVSSSFGPRWRYAKSAWEFHAGVDFFNATDPTVAAIPIFSIGAGTVYAKYVNPDPRFPNGGNALSIQHTLAEPVRFHGVNVTTLFSVYLHLDTFANGTDVGATIAPGQTIGAMGQTGDTDFLHLHFEARLGTMCSLPFQLANPSSSCAVLKKEPKVNPFLFLPDLPSGRGTTPLSTAIATVEGDTSSRRVTLLVPSRRSFVLNRIRFASVVLDFGLYTGFDPTNLTALNSFSFPWGKLVPGLFLSSSEVYNMTLEFPAGSGLPGNGSVFYFSDIRGNGVAASFTAATATPPATSGPSTSRTTASPQVTAAPLVPESPQSSSGTQSRYAAVVLPVFCLLLLL